MVRPWSEVEQSREFQDLSRDDREAARAQYWRDVVRPQIQNREDIAPARRAFFDRSSTSVARQQLPDDVQYSTAAGGGRGGQGGPTAEQIAQANPPTIMQRVKRGLSDAFAPKQTAAQMIEQPRGADEPIPREDQIRQSLSPEAAAQRDAQELARASYRPGQMSASPERTTLQRVLDTTNRKPLDGSLGGLALETFGDAARGAVRGVESIGTSGWGLVRAGADVAGADRVAGIAAEAGKAGRRAMDAIASPDKDSTTQQVFESTFANVPVLLGLGAGNGALAAMGGMSAGSAYDEARNSGKPVDEALERGVAHGVAEMLGEKFALPALGKLFTRAASKVSTPELGRLLADLLVKEQVGEQATTAMQDAYDKFGRGGTRPDMTLGDYLSDAIQTSKVTLGQSLLMGGGAAVVNKLAQPKVVDPMVMRQAFTQVANDHGLSPKAAAAIEQQAAQLPADQAPGFIERALGAMERRGLVKKIGASLAWKQAIPQPPEAQPEIINQPAAPTAEDMGWTQPEDPNVGMANAPAPVAGGGLDAGSGELAGRELGAGPATGEPALGMGSDAGALAPGDGTAVAVRDEGAQPVPALTTPAQPTTLGEVVNASPNNAPGFTAADVLPKVPATEQATAEVMQPAQSTRRADFESEDAVRHYLSEQRRNAGIRISAAPVQTESGWSFVTKDEPGYDEARQAATARAEQRRAIDEAAHAAATSPKNDLPQPTPAQKDAGNYTKGHATWNGLGLTIENPAGSKREGVDPNGKLWSVRMPAHYGYVKRTEGADGDHVDIYMGPNPDSKRVFVVDQVHHDTGAFDEHKVVLGANTAEQAQALYDAGFSDGKGPQRRAAMTELSVDEFKTWARDGVKSEPLGLKPAQAAPQESAAPTQEGAADGQEVAGQGLGETLQSQTTAAQGVAASADAQPAQEPIVTHTTGKGKTLTGYVRKVSVEQAKAMDPYTFKKDGGYFVRKARADEWDAQNAKPTTQEATAPREAAPAAEPASGVPAARPASVEADGVTSESTVLQLGGLLLGAQLESSGAEQLANRPGSDTVDSRDISATLAGKVQRVSGVGINLPGVPNSTQRDIAAAESGLDVGPRHTDLGAELLKRHPGLVKGLGKLNVEGQRSVLSLVRDSVQNLEVLKSVVSLVPVDVMNNLVGRQASSDVLLNNPAVLSNALAAIDPSSDVASRFISSVVDGSAGDGAKVPRPKVAISGAGDPAPVAGKSKHAGNYGASNTVFTTADADRARAILKSKLSQLNSGIDPEIVMAGITLAGHHIEAGARTFAAYSKAMLSDLGDAARPYLKSWYLGVRFDPRAAAFAGEMDSAATVEAASIEVGAKPADTSGATEAPNDARNLDRASTSALEGVPAAPVQGTAGQREAERGAGDGRPADGGRDAAAGERGVQPVGSLGGGAGAVPVPARGKRAGRGSAVAGVRDSAEREQPSRQPQDAGREGRLDPPQFDPVDFTIDQDFALGEGGQKTKYRQNADAIRLVKALESEGRTATVDEQHVLAKYVGWGGIPQAFDEKNADWAKQHAELRELLTPDELAAAAQSTQYAHYTSREIIGGMYQALRRMGFTGGATLEAGGGVGNFIGLMPADLRTAGKVTLVERETIAALIAKHLYPRQNVRMADFTEFGKGQDGQFDAQIGNPPFSSTTLTDQSGRKHLSGLSVHNYFIAKGIDMLREGGISAVVVSNSFLDAKGDRARAYIADRARFLGAIRLPNNAFSKNAGTEVTTDIVFFQKLPENEWGSKAAKADAKRWVGVESVVDAAGGQDLPLNAYFAAHPEMMLGQWGRFGTMYGPDQPALVAKAGQDTAALLARAVENLPQGIYVPAVVANTAAMREAGIEALHDRTVAEGGFYNHSTGLWRRLPDRAGEEVAVRITPETMWSAKQALGQAGYQRLQRLADMRRTVRDLLAAEIGDDAAMDGLRKKLNEQYDAYVADAGPINDRPTARLFEDDPDYPLLAALETEFEPGMGPAAAKANGIKPFKAKAKKAAIFDRRVVEARKTVTRAGSPSDALNIAMAERGRLDAQYIGQLLGRDPDGVLEELASGDSPLLFKDPATGEYVLRDAYLSGNVRSKLLQARRAGMMANARALEAVQPEDVPASQIAARIGSPWVPTEVYQDFAANLLGDGTKAAVQYMPLNSSFIGVIRPGSDLASRTTFGTPAYPAEDLLFALMNNREIKVTYRDNDGKTIVDREATELANEKAAEIKDKFQDWLFKDADRAETLVRAYNDANNNYVTRQYDGSWIRFPGKVPDGIIKFRRHQRNAIARTIQDRTALYDHVVGAGKTFTAIAAAMELKRTGLARKPMIVVPNHLVKQWAADFYRLYPGAKILTATKADFERANRRKFLGKIATGDWDAVIIAHSSFGFIKPAPEFEARFNEEQVEQVMSTIKAVEDGDGDERAKKRTVKQLEKMKERLENRVASLREKAIDDLLDLQQLGVDQLFVDEAHLLKNLMFSTKMQNVQGLGDSKGSKRAYDMYVKTRQIMDQNGRGQGVVFMTGTPVSNSLAEMYHMMRYLMPEQMKQLGFESFDAWANTFASVNQVWLQKASGDGFKASNRMSSFDNTAELLKLFDQVSDTVTMEDIKAAFKEENGGKEFPLPALKTGRRQPVSMDKSAALDAYMGEIAKRAAALEQRKGPPKKGDDNILVVMGDARKAAMDMRLVDTTATKREPGGRIDRAADEIAARWKQWGVHRGTQLVFSDMGTPLKSAAKELAEYNEIKARTEPLNDEQLRASADLGDEAAAAKLAAAEEAQAELDAKGRDWLDAIQAALRGFSVYDDLRAALVERGIPAEQVAFIHDFNTDDQKAALFRKVNNGDIRVLIGSTQKMGAGTNVQKRMVALHHLDVPWRPSDVEQREGRIIRQGNMLSDTLPGFEVEIMAYVTRDTLDMRMWQIQETKLKMINQLRTRQIEREIENAFEDMELSAGEMQAAATGNMDLLKEIQLRTDVQKLEKKQRAFDATRADMVSRRRRAEQDVQRLPARIEAAQKLADATAEVIDAVRAFKSGFKVTINGQTYTDRALASAELRRLDDATETGEDGKEKKAKLSVEMNGETYTSRTKMAEAFARLSGDVEPFMFSAEGQTFHRRADAAQAIQAAVADAVAEEARREIGAIGPYTVTVEGQADKRGERFVEVVVEAGGQVLDTSIPVPTAMKDPEQLARKVAEDVLKAARAMVWGTADNLQWEKRSLERARKTLADLESTESPDQWPDAAKLEQARAAHKEVLQRLNSAKAAPGEFSGDAKAQAVAAVAADVEKARSEWANAPETIVAFDMNDAKVPKEARDDFDKLRRSGAVGTPEGFFLNGKVYLLASQIRTPEDAVRVFAHETLGHYGLRGAFGDQLAPMLDRLAKALPEKVEAKAKQYGLNMADAEQRRQAAEEYLAELAQTRPTSTWVQSLVARIRTWLREHLPGFGRIARMTDAEVISQFIAPARGWVERGSGGTAGPTRFQIVFHGTPHRGIEQFSTDKIGTGEGAQAYGWGLYMASRREVAEFYRKKLTPGGDALRIDGKKPEFDMGGPGGLPATQDGALTNKAILMLQEAQSASGLEKVLAKYADPAVAARARELLTRATWVPAGQLYEAEIPEDDTMLHWDKPLSEQPEKVRDALAKDADFKDKNTLRGMRDRYGASGNADPTGEQIYNHATLSFHAFDGGLADGTPAGASKYLASLGIKGIKYLDGTSRSAGEGSYNYVIFDGADAKITKTHFSLADKARAVVAGKMPGAQLLSDIAVNTPVDGRLHWWHKTVGTMNHLAAKSKPFARVYDGVQQFITDTSKYATESADLAPQILPKLEHARDIIPIRGVGNAPMAPADNKMLATTVFHGTLYWTRDRNGKPVKVTDAEEAAAQLDTDQKARVLLRDKRITPEQMQRMQANPLDIYDGWVRNQFEAAYLRPGIVFTPDELKHHFGANDAQVKHYQQFRAAVDRSLTDLAISDMLRVAGEDAAGMADAIMGTHDVTAASDTLAQHLRDLQQLEPERARALEDTVNSVLDKADKAADLMARGYAPLMRFGSHKVDVVDATGERLYFGLFETPREAAKMARQMREQFHEAQVTRGTLSQREHELYAGVTPETLELFGEILGLDKTGGDAQDQMFQEYLRTVKNQRSAMKRLIHRKGIAGYSEDAGRVLAGFVYSNARQTAGNLHVGAIGEAIQDIPREQGELKDVAVELQKYIFNPQEESQKIRGLLFAQYLGGSIASAAVNLSQTPAITFPYLSQFGGAAKAAAEMGRAVRDVMRGRTGDDKLDAALKTAAEEGIVAPQEVFQLMAQSRGAATLKAGDGTLRGNLAARTSNTLARLSLAWGKPFSLAEMANRKIAFIAAYRMAPQGKNPAAFAERVVNDTQFVNNKGNKPHWARGSVKSLLFTFKSYSVNYLQLLNRMWTQGEPGSAERRAGRRAVAMSLLMLWLLSGTDGLPGEGDVEDLIDGLLQRLGLNYSTKQAKLAFLVETCGLGEVGARFVTKGLSGLPGAPIDVSGRLGLGNLIPGTGLFPKKDDYTQDVTELAGPVASFAKSLFQGAGALVSGAGESARTGEPGAALQGLGQAATAVAPVAAQNLIKAADMAKTGMYRDTKGRKVVDVDAGDVAAKAIGFQPNVVARTQLANRTISELGALNKQMAADIADRWAAGIIEKDDRKALVAQQALEVWNRNNPESVIQPSQVQAAVRKKVRDAQMSKSERTVRQSPKGMRAAAAQELMGAGE